MWQNHYLQLLDVRLIRQRLALRHNGSATLGDFELAKEALKNQ